MSMPSWFDQFASIWWSKECLPSVALGTASTCFIASGAYACYLMMQVRTLRGKYMEGLATVRRETQDAVQGTVGELEDCIQREVLKATSRSRTMMRREQQVQNASARKSRSNSSNFGSADTQLMSPLPTAGPSGPEDTSMLANIFDSIKELKAALQQVQAGAASVVHRAPAVASVDSTVPVSLAAALGTSPSLQKYARMLSMGIPEQAVKNKMKMDGVSVPTTSAPTASGPPAPPAPPGMAPPPPPSFGAATAPAGSAPKGFIPRVHADPAFSKYRFVFVAKTRNHVGACFG